MGGKALDSEQSGDGLREVAAEQSVPCALQGGVAATSTVHQQHAGQSTNQFVASLTCSTRARDQVPHPHFRIVARADQHQLLGVEQHP